MELTVAIIIGVALLIAWKIHSNSRQEELARLALASNLGEKLKKSVEKIKEGSTLGTRVDNCTTSLKLLEQIESLDPEQKVVQNRIVLGKKILALRKILPIHNCLEKADKAEFKGQKKVILNAMLDALYQCKKENVIDEDFRVAGLTGDNDEQVTLQYLREKAISVGWECDEKTIGEAS